MRKLDIIVISGVAALGFAAPVAAQNYGWDSRHDWQHERLDQRHDDVHDQLDEEHAEAHAQGLSPWEHRELHQQLREQHEYADYRIALQHQREHRREAWRHQYRGHGYYPQYGY